MNLYGKMVLVIGFISGIGLGIVKVLVQVGVQLVFNGFGDSSYVWVEVVVLGKIFGYYDVDLCDVGQIEVMMCYVESIFGGVDIVINNVGIQYVVLVEQFLVDKWNDIFVINFFSVFYIICLVLLGMCQCNWGCIINIVLVYGLVVLKEKLVYVVVKYVVVGLIKIVVLEIVCSGIICNVICSGWVLILLVQQQIDKCIVEGVDLEQVSVQLLVEKQFFGEFVILQQLGEMVLFLCSDVVVQVCGVVWNMDGGWVVQ